MDYTKGMEFGHYRNPVMKELGACVPLEQCNGLFQIMNKRREIIRNESPGTGNNLWEISLNDFVITNTDLGIEYSVAVGIDDKTPESESVVLEKWENPYWKRNKTKMLYLPGESNPIGRFLIVLYDLDKEGKINQSIHRWTGPPVRYDEFRQDNISEGCVILAEENMEDLFHAMKLGDRVRVY